MSRGDIMLVMMVLIISWMNICIDEVRLCCCGYMFSIVSVRMGKISVMLMLLRKIGSIVYGSVICGIDSM